VEQRRDCNGLPLEQQVEQAEQMEMVELTERLRETNNADRPDLS
jgi:hypothetical protein